MTPNPYFLAAENPTALLTLLRSNPSLASGQDEHGYSLLHAATSYGHIDLLRALVREFNVDVNLTDEDGETCLFVTEDPDIAKCLVEELGIDPTIKNDEGLMAQETIANDDSFPAVAAYLSEVAASPNSVTTDPRELRTPPSLPPNVTVTLGAVSETEANGGTSDVDPEFKRRIDELAAREDFHSEAGQNELRALVVDAIRGVGAEAGQRDVRRRIE